MYSKSTDTESKKVRVSNTLKTAKRKHVTTNITKLQDDGLWKCYKSRLKQYYKKLEEELLLEEQMKNGDDDTKNDDGELISEEILKGGLKVPIKTWNKLYR